MFFFAMMAVLLLEGCVSESEKIMIDTFKQKRGHYQKLIKTEKAQFYDKNITKILLTATYLGESDNKEEIFVVGVYRDDDLLDQPFENLLHLYIDGRSFTKIKPLKAHDKRLRELPFSLPWLDYYEIRFSYVSHKDLVIDVVTNHYGHAEIRFAKVAKYTLNTKE